MSEPEETAVDEGGVGAEEMLDGSVQPTVFCNSQSSMGLQVCVHLVNNKYFKLSRA